MLSQEPWKYSSYKGGAHWLKYQSVHSCYSFAEKWSRKTRINDTFQPLYPVTAWMKKLLQKARVTAPIWHQEVHITILFSALKAASEERNSMSSGCSVVIYIVVCLLVYCVYKISIKANIQVVNREKDPVHQICIQEPHCQVPSVAGHGLSYWLWYHSMLVGQRECISSEHFSEGFLSRTWAVYLVVLVQLMLIWWKLYTLLSVL